MKTISGSFTLPVYAFTEEANFISALRDGQRHAYDFLYRNCRPVILNFVTRNSGTQEDGMDLLQEAMIVLFRKLQQREFILTCHVHTYIYSVCRQMWLYQLRKKKLTIVDIADFIEIIPEESKPAALLTDQQLGQAIDSLDEKSKQLLIRYYYQDQGLEEIAQVLNLSSANAAKVRKFRCLKQLRAIVKGFFKDSSKNDATLEAPCTPTVAFIMD